MGTQARFALLAAAVVAALARNSAHSDQLWWQTAPSDQGDTLIDRSDRPMRVSPWSDSTDALPRTAHPRLILTSQDIDRIRLQSALDPGAKLALQRLERSVGDARGLEPATLELGVGSRTDERDLISWALLSRITGRGTYAQRGRTRLLSVLNDTSWYSGDASFLDWGDTMHGVSIALDWLWDELSTAEQATASARLSASLRFYSANVVAGKGNGFWYNGTMNWNIIVNSGAALGALALAPSASSTQEDPHVAAVAAKALDLSLVGLRSGFAGWGDDGGWSEGLVYDMYSLANAVDLCLGLNTSLGQSVAAPFMKRLRLTGNFIVQSIAPSGDYYNWADADNPPVVSTAYGHASLFGLARMFNRADWAFVARSVDQEFNASLDPGWLRLPADVMYYTGLGTRTDLLKQQPLHALFPSNDVVIMRNSWTSPGAMWLGAKGGWNDDPLNRSFRNSATGHSHLDQGSFAFELDGVRWAHDLGNDNYELSGYFGDSRFQWYRLNTSGHNTLRFDGDNQRTGQRAHASLNASCCQGLAASSTTRTVCKCAVLDMADAYSQHGVSVQRGIAMMLAPESRSLVIVDEMWGSSNASTLTWQMHTFAPNIAVTAAGLGVRLKQTGRTLHIRTRNETDCPGASFATEDVFLRPPQHPANGLRKVVLTAAAATCRRIALELWGSGNTSSSDSSDSGVLSRLSVNPISEWSSRGLVGTRLRTDDDGIGAFPRLLTDRAGIGQVQQRVKRSPYNTSFAAHVKRSNNLTSEYNLPNAALLYIGTGELHYAHAFFQQLLLDVRNWARLLPHNGSAGLDYRSVSRGLQIRTISFDLVAASGVFTPADVHLVQTTWSLACSRLMETGPSSFNRYDVTTNEYRFSNTDCDRLAAIGLFALLFPDDGRSPALLTYVLREVSWILEHVPQPDGGWPEGTRYQGDELRALIPFWRALQRQGGHDFFANGMAKKSLQYLVRVQTPPDLTEGGRVLTPGVGDANWETSWEMLLGAAAPGIMAAGDHQLAAELMAAWVDGGSQLSAEGSPWMPPLGFVLIDDTIPAAAAVRRSELLTYHGILRADRLSALYLTVWSPQCRGGNYRCVNVSGYPRMHEDSSSFSLFADGVPLIVDPGVHGYTSPEESYLTEATAHSLVTVDGHPVVDGATLDVSVALMDSDQLDWTGLEWLEAAESPDAGWSAGLPGHCIGGAPTLRRLLNASTATCKAACEADRGCHGISISVLLAQCNLESGTVIETNAQWTAYTFSRPRAAQYQRHVLKLAPNPSLHGSRRGMTAPRPAYLLWDTGLQNRTGDVRWHIHVLTAASEQIDSTVIDCKTRSELTFDLVTCLCRANVSLDVAVLSPQHAVRDRLLNISLDPTTVNFWGLARDQLMDDQDATDPPLRILRPRHVQLVGNSRSAREDGEFVALLLPNHVGGSYQSTPSTALVALQNVTRSAVGRVESIQVTLEGVDVQVQLQPRDCTMAVLMRAKAPALAALTMINGTAAAIDSHHISTMKRTTIKVVETAPGSFGVYFPPPSPTRGDHGYCSLQSNRVALSLPACYRGCEDKQGRTGVEVYKRGFGPVSFTFGQLLDQQSAANDKGGSSLESMAVSFEVDECSVYLVDCVC